MGIVYCAQNLVNQKIYIGKTIHSVEHRMAGHKGKAIRGLNNYFQKAIRKHGFDSFDWCVLTEEDNENKLNELEKYWIKILETTNPEYGYNICEGGGRGKVLSLDHLKKLSENNKGENNPYYGKKHTEETKNLMSIAAQKRWAKPAFREKACKTMAGRVLSEETKKKISKTRLAQNIKNGMQGRHHTEETKQRIREAHTGMKCSEKAIENMCKAQKGKNNAMYGKIHSEETRIKIGDALKGSKNPMYGKKHSEATIAKMKLAALNRST